MHSEEKIKLAVNIRKKEDLKAMRTSNAKSLIWEEKVVITCYQIHFKQEATKIY